MEAEYTITALGSLQEPQSILLDEILVLVEKFISQLYQPLNRYLTSQGTKMACMYVQNKIRRIG